MCEVESNDRPKWLLELENRKRKPRLAHEAGAGALCVTCKAACPGLDLHFWRKICKNCKCSKDDHDVQDEDFPQFDLLFGNSRKYKKKPILLHINNEKEHAEEQAFEWVPPDITKELATDYMKALPVEKLPIKGSTGAALRRQLLQKQLPLHDIDHKACDKLSEQEQKQFEKYLESIKKYVGQGTVRKILSARPFDRTLMTPANATDMQRFSPQNKPNIPSSMVQLRTPSSFTPKTPYKKDLHDYLCNDPNNSEITNNFGNVRNVPVLEKYNIIGNNGETVRSEPIKSGSYNKAAPSISSSKLPDNKYHDIAKKDVLMTGNSCLNSESVGNVKPEMATPWKPEECYKDTLRNPNASLLHSKAIDDNAQTAKSILSDPNLINDNAQLAESILAEAFLPPSMVHANDIIGSTLDEKGLMYIREKLSNKYSSQENHGQIPYNSNYARDLDSNESLRKTGNISSQNTNANIDKGPDRSTVIAAMKNPSEVPAPSQDRIQRNTIESKPMRAEKDVLKAASQIIQSAPLNANEKENTSLISSCKTMDNPVTLSSPQTRPQIANVDNHPAKLNSFTIPSSVIYSEKLQNQIFPHDSIGTANQSVQNLPNIESLRGAMEDLMVDTKQQKCHKCEEEIRVGDVAVVTEKVKNTMWHPGCFVCNTCNELLVDLVYFYYKNKLYCGRDLATLLGIPRCFACDELIFVREYTVAEGHNYHVKHFCCWDCDVPLAGKQYITENDRPLCLLCYQKTYAKTCNTCEKVIAADQQGVAVKDLNFHATENCFCCHICKKNLLNGRMAVKESRLFCSKECISQFLHPQS